MPNPHGPLPQHEPPGWVPVRPTTRPARAEDLLGAAEARVASWRAAFTGLVPQDFLDSMDPATIASSWADSIAAGRSRLYVAVADEQVIGYAGVGPERDAEAPPNTGELYALFVHPDHWGTGAGRALTDAACTDLRDAGCTTVRLWVLEANIRAPLLHALRLHRNARPHPLLARQPLRDQADRIPGVKVPQSRNMVTSLRAGGLSPLFGGRFSGG